MTARTAGAAIPQTPSSGLRVAPVDGRADLDRFIRLPARLYSGWKGFVAPLEMERRDVLRQDKNPYFSHGTAQYWLAWRGDRPVGRISAQVDQLYLERHGKDAGHFGFLDAEDDPIGSLVYCLDDVCRHKRDYEDDDILVSTGDNLYKS